MTPRATRAYREVIRRDPKSDLAKKAAHQLDQIGKR
jgi:hypothetical protein